MKLQFVHAPDLSLNFMDTYTIVFGVAAGVLRELELLDVSTDFSCPQEGMLGYLKQANPDMTRFNYFNTLRCMVKLIYEFVVGATHWGVSLSKISNEQRQLLSLVLIKYNQLEKRLTEQEVPGIGEFAMDKISWTSCVDSFLAVKK
jgi:hypothetical protein